MWVVTEIIGVQAAENGAVNEFLDEHQSRLAGLSGRGQNSRPLARRAHSAADSGSAGLGARHDLATQRRLCARGSHRSFGPALLRLLVCSRPRERHGRRDCWHGSHGDAGLLLGRGGAFWNHDTGLF
jgi:hypothetical protein